MNLRTLATTSTLVAVAVLGVWTAAASATAVYTSEGAIYTGPIKAEASSPITLHGIASVVCNESVLEAEVETHGESVTAGGKVTGLTFSKCNQHVTVVSKGTLEFHATSGGNGTITSSGTKVTVQFTTIFGTVHCVFGTSSTDFGTLTASAGETSSAAFDIESLPIPVVEGSFLCGSSGEMTGSYKVTTPTPMALAPEPKFHFKVEKDSLAKGVEDSPAQVFTFGAVSVSCENIVTLGPLSPVKSAVQSFAAIAAYGECSVGEEVAAVEPNECYLNLFSGTISAGIYSGKVSVACLNKGETMNVETNKCVYAIPKQVLLELGGVKPVTYKEVKGAKKEVTAALTVRGIEYTETGNECVKNGETRQDGKYTGNILVKAELPEEGGQLDFSLEATP